VGIIQETAIEHLEKTRGAFKSKNVADSREIMERVKKNLEQML